MITIINVLNVLLPFCYLIAFTIYCIDFFSEIRNLMFTKRISISSIVILHLIYILIRTIEFNHAPITNKFELFTSIAFTVSLAYFILELLTNVRSTGFFIIFIALIFQLISSIFIENIFIVKEVLRNPLLGLHVISAMLGQTSLILSAIYGILFIILYNKIKKHNFGDLFNKLPNLELLEKMSFITLVTGYIILSFSIIIGAIWLPIAFPDFKHLDPKLTSTIFIWIFYTLGISAKKFFNWYGKKVIYLSLIGFVILIISMIIPIVFKSSFHNFQ